jgi:hypothetical protein
LRIFACTLQLLLAQQLSRLHFMVRGNCRLFEDPVALGCCHEAQGSVRRIALSTQSPSELQQLLRGGPVVYFFEKTLLEGLLNAVKLGMEARCHQ